jgi:hypothetical protein
MKHPTIFPGRGGLPRTSNVPWSAARERSYRQIVWINAAAMLLSLAMIVFVAFNAKGFWRGVLAIVLLLLLAAFNLWRFAVNYYVLAAMLLNKPRSLENLTPWTEHPWPYSGWGDPDMFLFFCKCGRALDFISAPFFKDTNRWAIVCECGRGHFMPGPKPENVCYFPSRERR